MMRGSSFLLEKSVRNYRDLVVAISKMEKETWEIDVDKYNEKNIQILIDCKNKIIDALGRSNATSWDTLVTKIMLGIFANIPAYDEYFKKFLKKRKYCQTFNKKSLEQLKLFYEENEDIFNSFKIYTFNFFTARETNIIYTKAKLIDMCGFVDGQ